MNKHQPNKLKNIGNGGWKSLFKPKNPRPTRDQLKGLNASEFKTLLKRAGHLVERDFYRLKISQCRITGRIYDWEFEDGIKIMEWICGEWCPYEEKERPLPQKIKERIK